MRFFILLSLQFIFISPIPSGALEKLEIRGSRIDFNSRLYSVEVPEEERDLSQALLQLPNFNRSGGSNRPKFFQIRGIGDRGQFEHSQVNAIGVFYEGIDLSEEASVLPLIGQSRLQVRYGPQTQKWGSKALGGSVEASSCFSQTCPTAEFGLGAGSFDELSAFGLGIRQTGSWGAYGGAEALQSDGPYYNSYLKRRTHDREELQFVAGGELLRADFNLKTHHLWVDHDNGYDAWNFDKSFVTRSDHPGRDRHQVQGHALHWSASRWSGLSSVTFTRQLESYDEDWGNNSDWNALPGWNQNYDYYSEFERQRWKLHQKLYYRVHNNTDFAFHYFGFHEKQIVRAYKDEKLRRFFEPYFQSQNIAFQLQQSGGISGWPWQISLRVENHFKKGEAEALSDHDDEVLWGGDFDLSTELSQVLSFHLLVQKAYRGGGYNLDPLLSRSERSFGPENLYHLQAGVLWQNGDHHLLLRGFSYWYFDQQVRRSRQVDPMDPSTFLYFTDNVGESRSYGLESVYSLQKKSWKLEFNVGLQESVVLGTGGKKLPNTPGWNTSLRGDYFFTRFFRIWSRFRAQDKASYSLDHGHLSPRLSHTDAGVELQLSNWRILAWVENVGNQSYPLRAYYFANEPPEWEEKLYVQRSLPRTYRTTVVYSF